MRGPGIVASAVAAAVLGAAALAGCGGVGEPYRRPAVDVPSAWVGQGEASAGGGPAREWWKAFASAELDALAATAQAGNHDLQAAAARVAQARALVGMAGAGLYPVIAVDAGSSRTWFSGNPAADSASAGVGVTWEADLWGSARYAQASAASTLLATRFGQEALRQGLVADVAAVYFQILAINDSLKVARDNLANVQRLLAVIEAQKQAGRISALELAQQRTVQASAEAAIPPLLQRRRTSLDALALLAGRTPEALTVSDTLLSSLAVPAVPLGLPAQLLEQRPDVRQVEAALIGANADIGAARAALWPRLQLSARAGTAAATLGGLFDAGTGFAAVGIDALATIFDAGRRAAQVELSRARQRELAENYRQTVLSAFRDVEDALAGIEHFAVQERAQSQAQLHAREAYRLAEIRYRAGASDFLTVLDAQRALLAADAALSGIRAQRFGAVVDLCRALGGGWQAFGEETLAAP